MMHAGRSSNETEVNGCQTDDLPICDPVPTASPPLAQSGKTLLSDAHLIPRKCRGRSNNILSLLSDIVTSIIVLDC